MEDVLAKEIKALGGYDPQVITRGVVYYGDTEMLYKSALWLRTALRLLKPIHTFSAKNEKELYNHIYDIEWETVFGLDQTFAIDSVVISQFFTHSKYVALKVKDAIADRFTKTFGKRPNVETNKPDILINIHVNKNKCTVSLDAGGDSLHKRGYRVEQTEAPLSEVLAAGMVFLSGYDGNKTFLDPMCGSGTLLIEAAMIAKNIAPGRKRKFAFMNWRDFDKDLWRALKNDAKGKEKLPTAKIIGSDISGKVVQQAIANITEAGVDNAIRISTKSIEEVSPPDNDGLIITNPPYGERLKPNYLNDLYSKIGDSLKNNFAGYKAWIFSSNKEALKKIGLRTSRKLTLYNGALECRYQKYELYQGSKKEK